jgi:hypothetical protein
MQNGVPGSGTLPTVPVEPPAIRVVILSHPLFSPGGGGDAWCPLGDHVQEFDPGGSPWADYKTGLRRPALRKPSPHEQNPQSLHDVDTTCDKNCLVALPATSRGAAKWWDRLLRTTIVLMKHSVGQFFPALTGRDPASAACVSIHSLPSLSPKQDHLDMTASAPIFNFTR